MDANSPKDIEQIKQLKARYFRLIDTKQWQALEVSGLPRM